MARTTVDIDTPIFNELKRIQKRERCSFGQLVSQLLAEALASRGNTNKVSSHHWVSQPMQSRVDLADKEAVNVVLDEDAL